MVKSVLSSASPGRYGTAEVTSHEGAILDTLRWHGSSWDPDTYIKDYAYSPRWLKFLQLAPINFKKKVQGTFSLTLLQKQSTLQATVASYYLFAEAHEVLCNIFKIS